MVMLGRFPIRNRIVSTAIFLHHDHATTYPSHVRSLWCSSETKMCVNTDFTLVFSILEWKTFYHIYIFIRYVRLNNLYSNRCWNRLHYSVETEIKLLVLSVNERTWKLGLHVQTYRQFRMIIHYHFITFLSNWTDKSVRVNSWFDGLQVLQTRKFWWTRPLCTYTTASLNHFERVDGSLTNRSSFYIKVVYSRFHR